MARKKVNEVMWREMKYDMRGAEIEEEEAWNQIWGQISEVVEQ